LPSQHTSLSTSPGVTGRHGLASFRPLPPQIFLSGHANSVLQKQAFIIYTNNITILAEQIVRHKPILLRKRTTVTLAYKLLVSFAYLLATALSSHNDVTLYVTAISAGAPSRTPSGGAHSAPPDPIAGFKGAYF